MKTFTLAILPLALISAFSHAAEEKAVEQAEVDTVYVTAEKQLQQSLGVSRISKDDIDKRPAATDISEFVRTMPGVNLTGNTATGQRGNKRQIDLRGMGPENTLILIDGKPTTLIQHGKLSPEACRSVGLSAADVALKLRSQGIFQLKQVKRAVIEQNGQLIIVQAGEENPKYPLITDGVVQIDILESIDKTEEWLVDRLAKDGYTDISNIFIAEYERGNLNVVTY